MSASPSRFLTWVPRILTVLFALFLGIFVLDVFGEAHGFWATTEALLIHLVTAALVLGLLAIAWRHQWVSALILANRPIPSPSGVV